MRSSLDEFPSLLSIFFCLNMDINTFREAFDPTSIEVDVTPIPLQEIAPKIAFGPPRIAIGTSENSKIEYTPERYLLQIKGPFKNIKGILNLIEQGMQNINYDLTKITRFFFF